MSHEDHVQPAITGRHRAAQGSTGQHRAAQGSDRTRDSDPSTNHDRRAAIRHVGVAGLSRWCSDPERGDGGKGTANQSGGAAGSATGSAGPGKKAVKAADIPVGGGLRRGQDGRDPAEGWRFHGLQHHLTHRVCVLAGVKSEMIICPCHRRTYDMATGQVAGGLAPALRPSKPATVSGGSITILTGQPRSLIE